MGLARASWDIWVPSRAWPPGCHRQSCGIQTTSQAHRPGSGLIHPLKDLRLRGKWRRSLCSRLYLGAFSLKPHLAEMLPYTATWELSLG